MSILLPMAAAVRRYVDERRRLGYKMIGPDSELIRFARYVDARQHGGPLTLELIVGWAREHVKSTSAVTAAHRLETVRPFAAYYRQFEPESAMPPPGFLGRAHRRLTPHIYSDEEIAQLLQAAKQLMPHGELRPMTYHTLFGLIAAAGLRVSEALNLTVRDVDLMAATIMIRQTKFRKSRCLPLHTSVVCALQAYRQCRERFHADDPNSPFFVSAAGTALPYRTVQHVFQCLRQNLAWKARGHYPSPRIHDLRHTFAVRRLQRWQEHGQSMDHALFWLCTYLGHAKISDTYWYLTGIPELMNFTSSRFEQFVASGARS